MNPPKRFSREHLIHKALLAVEEAVHEADGALPRHTLQLKFALAFLYSQSDGDRSCYDKLWRGHRSPRHPLPNMQKIISQQNINSTVNGIFKSVGVYRSSDYMFYFLRQKDAKQRKSRKP